MRGIFEFNARQIIEVRNRKNSNCRHRFRELMLIPEIMMRFEF